MSLTTALAEGLGDHLFRTATLAKPSAWWIGLFTTLPSFSTGLGGVEVVGGGYARQQLNPGDANWLRVGTLISNIPAVQFPVPTADWGTVFGYGMFAASSGGTPLIVGQIVSAINPEGPGRGEFTGIQILAGEAAARFDVGHLQFQFP